MPKISKRLRFEILRRDNHACRYCGTAAPDAKLVIDHVIPDVLGGRTGPDNLVAACESCNSGKSSASPDAPIVDDVAEGALRWAQAMKYAAQLKEKELQEQHSLDQGFLEIWNRWKLAAGTPHEAYLPLPDEWDDAIRRLRVAGMTERLFTEAVDIAMKATKVPPDSTFRYFCGVAWNMVTDMQKTAQDIAAGYEPRTKRLVPGLDKETISVALDAAMDNSGILLEAWQYDELVLQLAQALVGRPVADAPN